MLFGSLWLTVPLAVVGFFVGIFILQLLWNTTMPDVFGVKKITFFQTFKILIISMVLTGGGSSLLSFSTTQTTTTDNVSTTHTIKFGLP